MPSTIAVSHGASARRFAKIHARYQDRGPQSFPSHTGPAKRTSLAENYQTIVDRQRDAYVPYRLVVDRYFDRQETNPFNVIRNVFAVRLFGTPAERACLNVRQIMPNSTSFEQIRMIIQQLKASGASPKFAIQELLRLYSSAQDPRVQQMVIDSLFEQDQSAAAFGHPLLGIMMQRDLFFYSPRNDVVTTKLIVRLEQTGFPVCQQLLDTVIFDSDSKIRTKAISLLRYFIESLGQDEDTLFGIDLGEIQSVLTARWDVSTNLLVVTEDRPWRGQVINGRSFTIAKRSMTEVDPLTDRGDHNSVQDLRDEVSSLRLLLKAMRVEVPDLLPQDIRPLEVVEKDPLAAK